MNRIESGWLDYRKKVVPASASAVQVDETRNGFYAGAFHLLATIMEQAEPGTEPTAADLKMMEEIQAEFEAFIRSKRGS